MAVAPPLPNALRWGALTGLILAVALLALSPLFSAVQLPKLCLQQAQAQWPNVDLVAGSLRQERDTVAFSLRQAGDADPIHLTCTATTHGFSRGSTSPTLSISKSVN